MADTSSNLANMNANLQSQIAAGQSAAKNEDPDGIFELITEHFNSLVSFVAGKVLPVVGLGKPNLDISNISALQPVNPEQSAPIAAGKNIMPGTGGPTGGAVAKGLSKLLGFKNLLNGLSAPVIEALQQLASYISESGGISHADYGDLGTLSSPIFASSARSASVGADMHV